MSLLADLLSRAKNGGEKNTTVPPHLASIVTRASDKKKRQTKLIITAAVVLFVVIAGFAVVYIMDAFMGPSLIKKNVSGAGTNLARIPPLQAPVPAPAQTPPVETPQKADAPAAPRTDTPTEEAKKSSHTTTTPANTNPPAGQKTAAAPAAGESTVTIKDTKKQATGRSERAAMELTPSSSKEEKRIRATTPASDKRKGDRDAALYSARDYEASGNLAQAITYYKKALQLDGNNYIVMTSLAGALIKTGAYDEAAKYCRLALNRNRDYTPAMINLAISSIRLGNFEEGEQSLLRARSLEPANRTVLYNLGLLYENQKRYQEAYNAYEKIAAGGNTQGLASMGRVLEKQGKRDDARNVYRNILSSDTADAAAKQYANDRLVALGN